VLQKQVHSAIQRAFPSIRFIRTGRENLHWLGQAVVTTVVASAITGVLGLTVAAFMGISRFLFGN